MGFEDIVHVAPQSLDRMATMASVFGARTDPEGTRPMQPPAASQRSIHSPDRPAGAADEVQVEPPSVVVMKKFEVVPLEFVKNATQSTGEGQESCSSVG